LQTENLQNLKIHKLSKAQYDREQAAGNLDSTALYLTPEEAHTHKVVYTPVGSISKPGIKITPNTTDVYSITGVGSTPSLTHSEVAADNITGWSAGSLPSLTFSAGTAPSASLSGGSASISGKVSTGPNRVVTISISHSNPTLTFKAGTLPSASLSGGALPSLTYSEVKASKITAWSAGSVPTRSSSAIKAITGVSAELEAAPTFTGAPTTITTTENS
jgi:hypothetical protein